jgi:hypothetical protein
VQVIDFIEYFVAEIVINLSKPRIDAASLGSLGMFSTKLSTTSVGGHVIRLGHNREALHLPGVTICFPSYKPQAGRSGLSSFVPYWLWPLSSTALSV